MRKSKLNKLENEIRDMLKKEDTMTLDEMIIEVDRLMEKYKTTISMLGTDEMINDFNKQEQIAQDKIITLLDVIYTEYPISDILFEIKENNKISLANLEFDY